MNSEERLSRTKAFLDKEIGILETKGREYTAGAENGNDKDTLVNFKQVGEMVSCKCEECGHVQPIGARAAWAVYFLKHVFSVMTYIGDPDREMSEPLEGRLLDIRVYSALLDCIDHEDRTTRAQTTLVRRAVDNADEATEAETEMAEGIAEHRAEAAPKKTRAKAKKAEKVAAAPEPVAEENFEGILLDDDDDWEEVTL